VEVIVKNSDTRVVPNLGRRTLLVIRVLAKAGMEGTVIADQNHTGIKDLKMCTYSSFFFGSSVYFIEILFSFFFLLLHTHLAGNFIELFNINVFV